MKIQTQLVATLPFPWRFCCILLVAGAAHNSAEAQGTYHRFERMWPTLQQPWYFNNPFGVAVESEGHIYVADTYNYRIQCFTQDGMFVAQWGSQGSGEGQFAGARSVAVDNKGNVYVADTDNHRIQKFTGEGQFVVQWGSQGSGEGQFFVPYGIAVDGAGHVYGGDSQNHRIQKFSEEGVFLTQWGSQGNGAGEFWSPLGVAVDGAGCRQSGDPGVPSRRRQDA